MNSKREALNLLERKPVWEALSTLFLDTDISSLREYRAERLASSPYGVAEIETILADEVYPICAVNLLSIAGEWAGFDEEWLANQIMRRLNRPTWFRFWFGFRRRILRSHEWLETRKAIERFRRDAIQPRPARRAESS
jgi:hypothetical protein